MPLLVMVAGPNGSGKSTLIAALRADPVLGRGLPQPYINADDIQRERGFDVATAQRAATELRSRALNERRDVMYETVMSHPSKLGELQEARAAGYEVHVFMLATEDPSINVQRVALRVAAGGHDVPEDRIRQRYERTLALAPLAVRLADRAFVFDNSDAPRGLQLQAELVGDRLQVAVDKPAPWVELLAVRINERADEIERIQKDARDRGMPLQIARLASSSAEGPVLRLHKHHLVQQDERSNVLVMHDRSVLPTDLVIELGKKYRVVYREGVGAVQQPTQERDRSPSSSKGLEAS
jgi:predicted ABC-type ATPase